MTRRLVQIILGALTLGLIAWDVLLATDRVEGNTISEVVQGVAKQSWFSFLCGFVCGHWFWSK